MGELLPDVGIGRQGAKVHHLGPAIAQRIAHRLLHERVGNQDPEGRDVRADSDRPHSCGVHALGQPIPAKDPDAQEGGLQKEGE